MIAWDSWLYAIELNRLGRTIHKNPILIAEVQQTLNVLISIGLVYHLMFLVFAGMIDAQANTKKHDSLSK